MTRPSSASALWGRFVIGAPLGRGAFGEVERAFDRELGIEVAIKRLSKADPASLFRFKQEFRALVDLSHPNLVKLHELFCLDDDWYFSMDLIAGRPFSRFVWGGSRELSAAPTKAARPGLHQRGANLDRGEPDAMADARLRKVLPQLATGLQALHLAGLLHRDLKPSNVLVTDDGRLVILDFGLVAPMTGELTENQIVGTPGYMAPEQLVGQPAGAAADWYAVGVMIYEALVGRLPFVDDSIDLHAAQLAGAPDPTELRADAPADLSRLCMRLLSPRPDARPTGPDVLTELGIELADATPMGITTTGAFIGRCAELEALRTAHADASSGRPIVVQIHGPSGIGKTAIVRRFLDELRITPTVILEVRCHERESLRFKMIDGLVDAITQYLRALPRLVAASIMPRDPHALARLFPVFGRLPIVTAHPARPQSEPPPEQRRRAFVALRELLARLADRQPVVLFFDDLQWGDADSITQLGELLAEPDPPALLVVAAHQREDQSTPQVSLRQRLRRLAHDTRELVLGELSTEDADALARARLGPDAGDVMVERVVGESGGRPLLIEELARDRVDHDGQAESLDEILETRLAVLSLAARDLIALLASAGHPLEIVVARCAAKLTAAEAHAALTELRARSLVAVGTSPHGTVFEPLHTRIREAVLRAQTPEATQRHHLAIVDALLELGRDDSELIALHLQLADQPDRARPFLVAAAKQAIAALAFAPAIELYTQALAGAAGDARTVLQRELADVLTFAGRGSDAAQVYAQASESASQVERIELQRRAGEQLLRSGNIDQGLDVLRSVLASAGLSIPSTARRALASYLGQRARLKLRGRRFVERSSAEISPDDLAAVDACWTVGTGLAAVDLVRGGDFQTRHLLRALDLGEPYRIARGIALEGIMAALDGTRGQVRARALVTEARALSERVGNPHAIGWARAAAAVLAWCEGRFRDAVEVSSQGIALFLGHSIDSAWEVGTLDVWFRLRPLLLLGELDRFAEGVALCLAEAEERQDKFTSTLCRTTTLPWVHFMADHPDEAAAQSLAAIDGWMREDGWHIQHQENLRTQCLVDLYTGHPARAIARIEAARPRYEGAMLPRLQIERFLLHHIRGLAMIADVRAGNRDPAGLRLVERDAHRLRKEHHRWAEVIAASLEAGILAARRAPTARTGYAHAVAAFDGLGMVVHAAAARRRGAELLHGPTRATEIEAADQRLAALGIVDPERFGRMLIA